MDLVTIIVPIYNIEREYLNRCIESIKNQAYKDLDIILVDDGSTDGTAEYLDEVKNTDERITVIHKKNGGSSSARNLGIDNAKGQYIGFVDSDDYVDADFVELMMDAIVRNNSLMAQISRDEIDVNGNRRPDVCIPPEREFLISNTDQIKELLMHRGDCSFCTRLTKSTLFEGRRFPEGKLNEDFYLLIQMLQDINAYPILPKQAYHVFYRVGSNTRKKDANDFSRVFMDIVDNADYVEETLVTKMPELSEYAKRFALFQRLDYMLHIPISMMNADNDFYKNVVKYLRCNFFKMLENKYLTAKNKVYLVLLTIMPKGTRKIHRALR